MELWSTRAALPFVAMVVVILAQASNVVVTKAAISKGINKYVMVVYSEILTTLISLLSSHIIHRSTRPQLTACVFSKIFLLAVFGVPFSCSCLTRMSSVVGIEYGTPTLSAAMMNLIPAFTFILAVCFRMEVLNWRSRSSQAKSLGTFVSIAGAFVMTFYEGPPIIRTLSGTAPLHQGLSQQSNWILGAFFLAVEAFLVSAIYILQVLVLRKFPAVLLMMVYQFFFNTLLSAVFSLAVVTDPSAWKLRLDIELFAIIYSAVVGIFLRVGVATCCLSMRGPLYVSMFKPLGIILSVVMGVTFLGDPLCPGSLIGGVITVAGFYAAMWGKSKEEKTVDRCEKVPLLQNRIEERNCMPSAVERFA